MRIIIVLTIVVLAVAKPPNKNGNGRGHGWGYGHRPSQSDRVNRTHSMSASCVTDVSGLPPINDRRLTYIVGGEEANRNSLPWQVALHYYNSFTCGGILFRASDGNLQVLTAAHCIDPSANPRRYKVILGLHDRRNHESHVQTIVVQAFKIHANYDSWTISNDIAILILREQPTESNQVRPICITANEVSEYLAENTCLVSGWGSTQEGGSIVNTLQQVYKPLMESSQCKDLVSGFDETTMICSGELEGGVDACQGDSGGPFICKINGIWKLTGIVSWGYGCAQARLPGVYTNVFNYVSWIADNDHIKP